MPESGNITAGNASQISDGGSAVVALRDVADRLSAQPWLSWFHMVKLLDQILVCLRNHLVRFQMLSKGQLTLSDIDLFEINEAFAAVSVASMSDLGIDDSAVNVNGVRLLWVIRSGCLKTVLRLRLRINFVVKAVEWESLLCVVVADKAMH